MACSTRLPETALKRRKEMYAVKSSILVVGLGEVGKPLLEVIGGHFEVLGIDIDPVEFDGKCEVLHICIPFQIHDFVGACVAYINQYQPRLTVINSTVAPGTTRAVFEKTGTAIAYSPVRGKHSKMKQELLYYTKFVGGINPESSQRAAEHFRAVGMDIKILSSPEAAELAKLTETTYFGILIAWAQEIERYCDHLSVDYDEIVSYFEEIRYLPPVKFFPGVIGGHCVMPNIAILKTIFESDILAGIQKSNEAKKLREAAREELAGDPVK
jgi:UDP-N-acetyl-D-mannosaminuronate dehydrogenase